MLSWLHLSIVLNHSESFGVYHHHWTANLKQVLPLGSYLYHLGSLAHPPQAQANGEVSKTSPHLTTHLVFPRLDVLVLLEIFRIQIWWSFQIMAAREIIWACSDKNLFQFPTAAMISPSLWRTWLIDWWTAWFQGEQINTCHTHSLWRAKSVVPALSSSPVRRRTACCHH